MTNQNPTDNRAELEAALRELITYADLMPKKTPAAGSCVTEHQFTITAGAIWGLDERVQKAKSALAALASPTSDQERGLEEVLPERLLPIFLTASVSEDTSEIGIDHPTEADWEVVLRAHIALRDRLNLRIAEQSKCPFKPTPPTVEHAAPQAEVERVAEALAEFADAHMISPGSAVLWADRTPANREYFTKAALTAIAALSPSSSTEG